MRKQDWSPGGTPPGMEDDRARSVITLEVLSMIGRRNRNSMSLRRTMLPAMFTGSRGTRAAYQWPEHRLSFSTRMWTWNGPPSAPKMAATSSRSLKPGHYQMSARIDGYASPGIMDVDVIPGQSISSDILLKSDRSASILRNSGSGYRTYNGDYRAEPASLRVADPQPSTDASSEGTVRTAEATSAATAPIHRKTCRDARQPANPRCSCGRTGGHAKTHRRTRGGIEGSCGDGSTGSGNAGSGRAHHKTLPQLRHLQLLRLLSPVPGNIFQRPAQSPITTATRTCPRTQMVGRRFPTRIGRG